MIKNLIALLGLTIALPAIAQTDEPTKSDYDLDAPFGFCTVSSRTTNTPYSITGGGCYQYPVTGVAESKVTTLTSNGTDMRNAIINAINDYDVIVFDGSNGDFIVSKSIDIEGKSGKTLLGINGARLCTQWYLTSEMIAALDEAGVDSMSTSTKVTGPLYDGGSNVTAEEKEFYIRKILIAMTGDKTENTYKKAGIFSIKENSENIIIRNITFQGPGSVDVGGSDLISIIGSKHIWVDHCVFKDGTDGNLDITNSADFNTISWCTFSYSNRSYNHQNTNLVGSSDDGEATGYLNTTYAFNWWGKGCDQRMPMARVGKIHMLNNYYTCSGSSGAINPRKNSEFLIEGNYIDTGVERYYSQKDATAVTWTTNNFIAAASELPSSKGSTVTVPYSYTANSYDIVPTDVRQFAGATLFPEYNDTPTGLTGAITWPFNTGTTGQTATVSSLISEGIASTSVELGSDLAYDGKGTAGTLIETKIRDLAYRSTAASSSNAITFTINIANGYKFTATDISLTATRFGTDAGNFDVNWVDDGGTINVLSAARPNRENDTSQKFTTYSESIAEEATESENPCKLIINLYGVTTGYKKVDNVETTELNYKDYGFANIIVNGTLVAPTGISTPVTFTLPVTTEYYNLAGQRVSSNTKGIVIEKQKMQDGTVKAVKKIRR
ncbi:MAG: polysaccharide lyase family 1 protein [Prevotella sp.]|nr:polysaccharide lyase family 1 protein [Prevotella sp.]